MNAQSTIPISCFDMLHQLAANNTREWFALNKEAYLEQRAYIEAFADVMLMKLNSHDLVETPNGKRSLYRIHRDVRFSKDKTPFSTYWGGRFKRAGKHRRGGYYLHFEPGDKSFILCGFWAPNPADLKRIRDDIAFDAAPMRAILNHKDIAGVFTLEGEKLKTTPKGFEAGHDAIDLLRYKQFLLIRRFTDAEVLHPNFLHQTDQTLRSMRPFLNYMSEVLTGDENGEVG
jgi:uncharacterized protein (TIGR02453 family)